MKTKLSALALCLLTLTSFAKAGECAKTGAGMKLSQGGVFMVHYDLKDKAGAQIARAQEVFNASTFVFDVSDCNKSKLGSIREQMTGSYTNPYPVYKFLDAAGNEFASSVRLETVRGKAPSHALIINDSAGMPIAKIDGESVTLLKKGAIDSRMLDLMPAILSLRDQMTDRDEEAQNRHALGMASPSYGPLWLDGSPVVNEIPATEPKVVSTQAAAPTHEGAPVPGVQSAN